MPVLAQQKCMVIPFLPSFANELGYLYYLDGRELLVKPIGISGEVSEGEYRISQHAVTRLDRGIVFRQ